MQWPSERAASKGRRRQLGGGRATGGRKESCTKGVLGSSMGERPKGAVVSAMVPDFLKDETQCTSSAPSTISSDCRHTRGSAETAGGEGVQRVRKRQKRERKNSGGGSAKFSGKGGQKKAIANSRKARTNARNIAVDTAVTYSNVKAEANERKQDTERARPLKGQRPARKTGKKREAEFRAPDVDSRLHLDDLFLAHREKALRTGKYLGAHISAAGGAQNAPVNCLNVAGQAFAFFLKNQRRWESPPISEESVRGFKEGIQAFCLQGPQHILPHGSYLINLANPDSCKRRTSYDAFLDDLRRCEQLGIQRYVFHPGSTVGACGKAEGIENVARCLNDAVAATQQVTILLENMAGQKNVLCSTFEDLRDIIDKIERKDRVLSRMSCKCIRTTYTSSAEPK